MVSVICFLAIFKFKFIIYLIKKLMAYAFKYDIFFYWSRIQAWYLNTF